MHEMGIANSILEAVASEMRRHPETRATKVGVRIGELTAVDAESLRFCFEALSRDTDLEGLQLEIELCPRHHRCDPCGQTFAVRDYDFACPQCGTMETKYVSGDELELAYVEVEQNEPSPFATKSS
jgi:hydrogenase nickel incorporation protein HypA/HybF